jgi:hypothetical protein
MAAHVEPRLRVDGLAVEVAPGPDEPALVDEIGVAEDRRGAGERAARAQAAARDALRGPALRRRLDGAERATLAVDSSTEVNSRRA